MSQIKSHQYGSDGAETLDTLVTKKGEWTAAARTAISAARRLRLVRVRMGVERPPLLLCDAGVREELGLLGHKGERI